MTGGSHKGIYCDECGAYPIQGTRHKSLAIYDFDICSTCRFANYPCESKDFIAFDEPITSSEAACVGPQVVNRIDAQSAREAEEQLRKGRDAHVAFFGFFGNQAAEGDRQAVVDFINRNAHLTNIHIRLYSFQNHQDVFATITRGLLHNKSVKHLCFHLVPLHNQGSFLDPTPLKELIETNNTLQAMFITRAKYWPGATIEQDTAQLENEFASSLFESLKANRNLNSFRLETMCHLEDSTKHLAWDVVSQNSNLTRFYAKFKSQDDQLDMLLAFNQYQWMKRWTDTFATTPNRVEVVREILDSEQAQNATSLFHLLREFPEALRTMA
ncbi:unnamed protein product [Cylindrotheca closterium]|uniref:ZZ-type domain-containing protein n=1 Tax=Cylindrotheca closterium TaxID=2856 RepID=A0AAD2FK89_9STRA|nr:unnamed protein product [Cylindrotheca closterium]